MPSIWKLAWGRMNGEYFEIGKFMTRFRVSRVSTDVQRKAAERLRQRRMQIIKVLNVAAEQKAKAFYWLRVMLEGGTWKSINSLASLFCAFVEWKPLKRGLSWLSCRCAAFDWIFRLGGHQSCAISSPSDIRISTKSNKILHFPLFRRFNSPIDVDESMALACISAVDFVSIVARSSATCSLGAIFVFVKFPQIFQKRFCLECSYMMIIKIHNTRHSSN